MDGDSTRTKQLKLQYKLAAKLPFKQVQFVCATVQFTLQEIFSSPSLAGILCRIYSYTCHWLLSVNANEVPHTSLIEGYQYSIPIGLAFE